MFSVKSGTKTYQFNFRYELEKRRKYPTTFCWLLVQDEDVSEEIITAARVLEQNDCYAYYYDEKPDTFSKPVGRKESIKKAMAELDVPREDRKLIYDYLWERTNHKYQ